MRMDIVFWNMMIDNPNITVCATRYSTNDVPDCVFFVNGSMFRGTWNQAENAPDFWMVRITDNEFHNIAPRSI